jgi:glycosyltransferase involved in cell wall biosynthesis
VGNSMPSVSVIIPLYNKGSFIGRALDSVVSQTFGDFEVIVVDDGSTDAGPDVVGSFQDRRVRLIRQDNAGPGAARNRGVAESGSAFLAFLDADDEWMPEFLETCMAGLEANPGCDIAAASHYRGAERQDMTGVFRQYGVSDGPWRLTRDIPDSQLARAVYIMHSSGTLARRHVIERYGGFYSRNHCQLGEDYYLWLQVMLHHAICRILRPLWWFHTEASGLAGNDRHCRTMQPFLSDAGTIRSRCPADLRDTLERWLAMSALETAHDCAAAGNGAMVRELVDMFPRMKSFHWEYFKLRMKNRLPQLVPVVRFMRHGFGRRQNLPRPSDISLESA